MLPDWQLPAGVDRGLWDYLHASEMVAGYDEQMRASPLAAADIAFCERAFPTLGKLIDLGCGTGRLCAHFAAKGCECVGVDLSEEMLSRAREAASGRAIEFLQANLVDLWEGEAPAEPTGSRLGGSLALPESSFDYAACLFSTLGMVRGHDNRAKVVANAYRLLKPGGQFVLHAHNRFFRGLGWKRVMGQRLRSLLDRDTAGDITMTQAYGGAPLTLHHFTRREAIGLLEAAGFAVKEVMAIGDDGRPATGSRVYGWLMMAVRTA